MAKGIDWDEYFGNLKERFVKNPYFEYKGKELNRLIQKWASEKLNGEVLKTDLFEEAIGTNDEIIFGLMEKNKGKLWGMDISKVIVEKAKENALKKKVEIEASIQDARKTTFESNKFDLIISNSTLDHFPELDKALLDHYRILKKGGTLILTIHNKNNPLVLIIFFFMRMFYRRKDFTNTAYSYGYLKRKLKRIGFRIIDSDGINCSPPIVPSLINIVYKKKNKFFMRFFKKWYQFAYLLSSKETRLNYLMGYLLAFKLTKE